MPVNDSSHGLDRLKQFIGFGNQGDSERYELAIWLCWTIRRVPWWRCLRRLLLLSQMRHRSSQHRSEPPA